MTNTDTQHTTAQEEGPDTDTLDRTFDVLAHPARRRIVSRLADRSSGRGRPVSLDRVLSERSAAHAGRVELHHVHLPKLADVEVITWDPETGAIGRGAAFEEIAPFVRLCRDHPGSVPGDWA